MKKYICLIFIMFILNLFPIVATAQSQEYDVILFWGQSNMTGYNLDHKDVGIGVGDNIAFEYMGGTNSLREINDSLNTLGEYINYNVSTGQVEAIEKQTYFSLQESKATNLIPQFVKTYYELTGRKVIAIMASNGGEEIAHFMPHDQAVVKSSVTDENLKNQYIYEALEVKYTNAINLIKANGDKVGRQFYVVFQGEADSIYINRQMYDGDEYYDRFLSVHRNLKELGIEYGIIIETSATLQNYSAGVEAVHEAQENLISRNSDIILGSSYPYNTYKNNDATYLLDDKIHFNATALSLIGEQCSTAAATHLLQNYRWLDQLKINEEKINLSDSKVYSVNVPYETNKVTIGAKLISSSLSFDTDFGPREVSLQEGLNIAYLKISAPNSTTKSTYTIRITRDSKEPEEEKEESDTKEDNDTDVKDDTDTKEDSKTDTKEDSKTDTKTDGAEQVVDVDDTLSSAQVLTIIIGIMFIIAGIIIIIAKVQNDKD